MAENKSYFFCGIGGSGMLPLAMIVAARGDAVSGSDRSRDQGRTPGKFAWLESQGIAFYPQDGSGPKADQILVASAAIEDSVPDIAAANALGLPRMTRADLNAALFNAADSAIGVGGTSGKSTVTGMIGWILESAGRKPTVMNGAVMRNFSGDDRPFASALVGDAAIYVSEVDESDGSIALYRPDVAVVTNISLDHKSLEELHALFADFLLKARVAVVNIDDEESTPFLSLDNHISFGFSEGEDTHIRGSDFEALADGCRFAVHADGTAYRVRLRMPGRHNAANALAAIAATHAAGTTVAQAVEALADFAGLARRYEVLGQAGGVTVIDDFAHNPDKVAATLAAVSELPGRALIFFQPHGYGPLRQMGKELAASFAAGMRPDDKLFVCDPVYFGGTVDRSIGSEALVADIVAGGGDAVHMTTRAACGAAMLDAAKAGDRILILGARDDTLTEFGRELLGKLALSA
ncbi:UDP-N-acetylmuramate--alanine ligase [Sphingopyxis sp. H038]|uniref:Mur ligase family protein n=1 Tax=unclassified Sphingopyxis TaxID=2614943 RepID=UPI000730D954|nr:MULTISPECIES: Mur ligase family protein [unclassified Sphingopyxis]KTE04608.1 UDP-N-acetylmuramate--alanine ligase [Sphingopyxis sp. H012]KTE07859.1 UDP-N-acetylmuramate--alanine ligase [Sphingopyxis sp. H093]KTE13180.1 UDP-N-acetylmuramate--alanine ligase [Sphingopyxis sp. H053]KTE31018.1 UDP-N-acetylmuramate--alanine ligase [Sphingopyxis sp. H080]KTE37105.1 UDP-N-acetylmuramate--alanine ligase [Sphingopyxis sp. H038]